VELAGDLGEVVVCFGKLALLDCDQGDGDLGGLALIVTAKQLRLEGGGLASAERVERLVDAIDQFTRADLVGDALGGVNLFAADGGDQVDLGEVARLRRTVNGHQGAEALAQAGQLRFNVFVRDLDGVDGQL